MAYTQYPNNTFLIDMTQEQTGGKIFSELVVKTLNTYLPQGKRILMMVSKLGYASGRICNDCGTIPYCKQCDVAVGYHTTPGGDLYGLCPICKHEYRNDPVCENCQGHDVIMYGYGAQQIADLIKDTWGVDACIISSRVANSPSKVKKIQSAIQESQIVLSTPMIVDSAPGLDVDAVVMVSADTGLFSPDYQAARKTFLQTYQLVQQYQTVPLLIQTYKAEHKALHYACGQDYEAMEQLETDRRKEFGYPPYAEMCVLQYKHEVEQRTLGSTMKLYQELEYLKQAYEYPHLQIWTTPPAVFKMFGKYRYTVVMKGPGLRQFMDIAYSKLKMRSRGFMVDWEPQALV